MNNWKGLDWDNDPPRFNGGQRCDMRVGPCSCGAWHSEEEDQEKSLKENESHRKNNSET